MAALGLPADAPARRMVLAAVAGGRGFHGDVPLLRPDGRALRVELQLQPAGDGAVVAMLTDRATEQERADFLEAAIDRFPALLSYVDRDLRYRFNNQRYTEWFGRPVSDFAGRTVMEALGAETALSLKPALEAALAGEEVTYERAHRRVDGQERWLLIHYLPHRARDGSVAGIFVVGYDITDHKRAEWRLADSEHKLKEAQGIAEVGWWEYLADGGAVWSDSLYPIWGLDPATVDPTWENIIGLILPEDRSAVMSLPVSAARPRASLEFRIRRPDGEIRHLKANITASFDDGNRPVRWFGVTQDITEAKRAADELEAARRAAVEASQAKSRFLASASHDLRQPLNAMSLLVGVLAPRVTDPDTRAVVERLRRSLDGMMELFNALLDISKFEAGAVEVCRGVVRLDELLARIELDYAATARGKGLDFRVLGCRAAVWTDPTLLERILRNLVSNAISHTERGRVLVGCRRQGPAVRIDVIDTGPGIPPDQRQAVFEEFHQAAIPGGRRPEGHGLGLAIVKRAADLLDHPVEVESALGFGSRFSIAVPVSADLRNLDPVSSPSFVAAPAEMPLVAVIEDDALVGTALRMALEDFGCEVVVAATDEEVEERLARLSRPPQLVIADFRLGRGNGDGLDTVARLRGQWGVEAPAVLLSGDLAAPVRERAERMRVWCLAKPIRPDDLQRLLDAARRAWALEQVRPVSALAANE